jgi:hypothetical protein
MHDFRLGILLSWIRIGISSFQIGIPGTVDFILHYCMGVFFFSVGEFPSVGDLGEGPSINP